MMIQMSNEEKYKLALFAIIKNNAVMPMGIRQGRSMKEINTMTVQTMDSVMGKCDYNILRKAYEEGCTNE